MSVQEIEKWNSAYGLSKTLLRNLVVGIIVLLCSSNVWLAIALKRSNAEIQAVQEARVSDIKEFNTRLQHEKDMQDSLNQVYLQNFYKVKEAQK